MDDRERLEVEKLQIEIQNLRKPWWKRAEFLSMGLTGIIAILSLFYAFSTGILDAKSERLELQKAKLEREITLFEQRRDTLIEENARLRQLMFSSKDSLVSLLFGYQASSDSMKKKLSRLESEKQRLAEIERVYLTDKGNAQNLIDQYKKALQAKDEELRRVYTSQKVQSETKTDILSSDIGPPKL